MSFILPQFPITPFCFASCSLFFLSPSFSPPALTLHASLNQLTSASLFSSLSTFSLSNSRSFPSSAHRDSSKAHPLLALLRLSTLHYFLSLHLSPYLLTLMPAAVRSPTFQPFKSLHSHLFPSFLYLLLSPIPFYSGPNLPVPVSRSGPGTLPQSLNPIPYPSDYFYS